MKSETLIAEIRDNIRAFAADLSRVVCMTADLAPRTFAAYERFKGENPDRTKLDFVKCFASREQIARWPSTDKEAKAPGSPTQALFNAVEYLLRRGTPHAKPRQKAASPANVVRIIAGGWKSDLRNRETFLAFVGKLLRLKYGRTTVKSIIEKSESAIRSKSTVVTPFRRAA